MPVEAVRAACRLLARLWPRWSLKYLYGMQIGRRCHIGGGLKVVYPENVQIGDDVTIGTGVRFWSEMPEGNLTIAATASVARDCVLDFSGGLTIGEGTVVSEQVLIYTHDHGYDPNAKPSASPVAIGKNVWIGTRATILPAVNRIGDGSIIGAGTVVTRDVPADHVVVGSGSRIIAKRQSGLA